MKSLKSFFLPAIIVLFLASFCSTFYACSPNDCDDDDEKGCDSCAVVYKPNIYIYPEQETVLEVLLAFPKSGGVIASIPEYGNGWTVSVDTAGIVDKKYDYLFYESEQPDVWQRENGWCVKTENLAAFFNQNLRAYGFKGREIDDFIEYWIPRFVKAEYYIVYPQTQTIIDDVIELNISDSPDNILRLFYLVQESNINITIDSLHIEGFNRGGFYATEWGVILD